MLLVSIAASFVHRWNPLVSVTIPKDNPSGALAYYPHGSGMNPRCEHWTNDNPPALLPCKLCPESPAFIEKYYTPRPSRLPTFLKKVRGFQCKVLVVGEHQIKLLSKTAFAEAGEESILAVNVSILAALLASNRTGSSSGQKLKRKEQIKQRSRMQQTSALWN